MGPDFVGRKAKSATKSQNHKITKCRDGRKTVQKQYPPPNHQDTKFISRLRRHKKNKNKNKNKLNNPPRQQNTKVNVRLRRSPRNLCSAGLLTGVFLNSAISR
jgi:hypothetical protein